MKPKGIRFHDFGMGLLYFILATALAFLIHPYLELSNLIMVYLVGVMVTAIHCGRGPAILNSALSVVAFHFFFVPIRYSFTLVETHYIFTFAVMFLVALVISHLTILMRQQAEAARLQERQTAAMHSLSQQLAHTRGVEKILQVAVKQIWEIFESQVVALLPDEKGKLYPAAVTFLRSSKRVWKKNLPWPNGPTAPVKWEGGGPKFHRTPQFSMYHCKPQLLSMGFGPAP